MNLTGRYDFDSPLRRRGTSCSKWDGAARVFGKDGLLPFWVADMDFRSAPEIIDALREKVEFGVFGYPIMTDEARNTVAEWEKRRHGWDVDPDDVAFVPGVVTGLSAAVRAFTEPGDGVIIQTPVYAPFFRVITDNDRVVVENPLKETEERFVMDFDNLERVIESNGRVRAMILCSPHNPVARVWSADELSRLLDICALRGIVIINDEIHQDLVYSDARHIPIASLAESQSPLILTLVAPSKTFNIAGLHASAWITKDRAAAEKMRRTLASMDAGSLNLMAATALETAYSKGAPWLDEAMTYLEVNRGLVEAFLSERLPKVKMKHPEGTFIFWLDFREYGFHNKELQRILIEDAGVALNPGTDFGMGGDGFARFNIGCPRSILEEGLGKIERAFAKF
ncbi:MAG: pyridoxal phosphate-dependent aminotransferase [Synergistaceae bacterium]|nr:pyridoxal phosphate-dependent aminotransferase [Synergistaceae bacterium]